MAPIFINLKHMVEVAYKHTIEALLVAITNYQWVVGLLHKYLWWFFDYFLDMLNHKLLNLSIHHIIDLVAYDVFVLTIKDYSNFHRLFFFVNNIIKFNGLTKRVFIIHFTSIVRLNMVLSLLVRSPIVNGWLRRSNNHHSIREFIEIPSDLHVQIDKKVGLKDV